MTDLQPCPFCGSTNTAVECTGALEYQGQAHHLCWVNCNQCGANGPDVDVTGDSKSAADAWNERK